MDEEKYERLLKYEQDYKAVIKDYNFVPGDLVLIRNTQIEKSLDKKLKPRYLGPMVVVRRTQGGSYIVAELNGAVLQSKIGAFRVIPYYAREKLSIGDGILKLIDTTKKGLDKIELQDEDLVVADPVLDKVHIELSDSDED
ncbi:hypothetical protein CPC08DRAFT_651771 [Agrocybe pediades]|nr:hypothetical protein CPC08DRAFT_651771 [Agrocybe pediades]